MNKRTEGTIETSRLLDVKQLARYMNVGTLTASRFGKENNAVVRLGSRTLFDKIVIDRALDQLAGN